MGRKQWEERVYEVARSEAAANNETADVQLVIQCSGEWVNLPGGAGLAERNAAIYVMIGALLVAEEQAAEIARLKKAVRAAYMEGWSDAPDGLESAWETSEAKKAVEQ